MALKKDTVTASLRVELRPWSAPNFARRADADPGAEDNSGIPVRDLDYDALEEMSLAWLRDLYRKAGKVCPFNELPKSGPRQ